MPKPDVPKLLFWLSCAVAFFAYGFVVAAYQVFPYSILRAGRDAVAQVFAERETLLGLRPTEFLSPARYAGSGVTFVDRERASPGLTFMTGFFDDGNEMRLVDLDGTVVHRWPVNYFDLFPDPDHVRPPSDVPQTEWNLSLHGSVLLADGSVVFNFDGLGSAKMGRCGEVQWTVPRMTHHSVAQSADGGFWIPSRRRIEDLSRHALLRVPYIEDTVLKISRDGVVEKELSVLDALYQANLDGFLYRNPRVTLDPAPTTIDVTHVNDAEELQSDQADGFPLFAPGDLLLSLRFEHLVMVIDPVTLRVKWYRGGPWHGQHDPDFVDGGVISVLSNNSDGSSEGLVSEGSAVLEVLPGSGIATVRYGEDADHYFYTRDRGKHQRLGGVDGHIIIAEADAGRVIEVDSSGRLLWEYVNRYDETDVAVVTDAVRYPEEYFTVTDWSCP